MLWMFKVLFLLIMYFSHISLDSVYAVISQPSVFSLFKFEKIAWIDWDSQNLTYCVVSCWRLMLWMASGSKVFWVRDPSEIVNKARVILPRKFSRHKILHKIEVCKDSLGLRMPAFRDINQYFSYCFCTH